ncbi:MAG: ABC transporter permease, partial [Chloroflexi bacterium]|nr:ABC transporter permease [Chloroflexota bacterium]
IPLFPAGGYIYFGEGFWPYLHSLLLPAFLLGVTGAALITRMTRATMLEVLKEDYVRTARAKGLSEKLILMRHALRNAANPILTIIGFSIAGVVTGVVITETIFVIPGMGRLVFTAIAERDFPVLQSVILVVAAAYILVNLVIDIMYVYVDPRIRYQ